MTTTLDHVGINVKDFAKSRPFYEAALKPLGFTVLQDYGTTIGMGADYPHVWVSEGTPGHMHLAFRSENRKAVDAFHAAALKAGGKDNGKPGVRTEYSENYYAAYVHDPDGHNIEVVCFNAR